jgi:hypothetical protein
MLITSLQHGPFHHSEVPKTVNSTIFEGKCEFFSAFLQFPLKKKYTIAAQRE